MSAIRKVVIPVAGFGTRFLPATKAQPKEMLPVLDIPTIQYIVEDAVKSGIKDVILVTGKTKRAIEDHFDREKDMEELLRNSGKDNYADQIRHIAKLANFIYIRQKGPYGNGTPVMNAKHIINNEPFAVLWGDDIWYCPEKPQLKQLIDVYEKYGNPVLTAHRTDDEGTKKYGIIDGKEIEDGVLEVNSIIEKPGPEKAPSHIASLGGFIFTPDIFDALKKTGLGKGNELWLVDAIAILLQDNKVNAKVIDGTYYDIGSKFTWLKANVEFALRDKDLKEEFSNYLKSLDL